MSLGLDDMFNGVLSFMGQQDTNDTNVELAHQNREFIRNQDDTAHSREVGDLIHAGLNPMLSAKLGGSPVTPTAPAQVGNALGAGVNSAIASASIEKTKAEADQALSQAELNRAQIPKVASDINVGTASAGQLNALTEQVKSITMDRSLNEQEKKAQIGKLLTSSWLDKAHEARVGPEIENIKADTVGQYWRNSLLEYEQPRAFNESKAHADTFYGKHLAPYMPDLLKSSNSAASAAIAARGFRK
jgi:hypothetical protein